jgi:hypothetical protein
MNASLRLALVLGFLAAVAPTALGQVTITTTDTVPSVVMSAGDSGPTIAPTGQREDHLYVPPPGWFAEIEAGAAWTQVGQGVYGPPRPDLSRLGWGFVPHLEVGYRFDFGGAVLVDYRYLGDSTDAGLGTITPTGETHAAFTTQALDIDYQSRVYGCGWAAIQWQAGLRVGGLTYTSHHDFIDTTGGFNDADFRREIVGAGPHFGLLPALRLGDTGLAVFGLIDVGALTGFETHSVDVATTDDGGAFGSDRNHSLEAVLQIATELGLSYTVPTAPWMRIASGYRVETSFWDGRSFTDQGPFLRLGVGF